MGFKEAEDEEVAWRTVEDENAGVEYDEEEDDEEDEVDEGRVGKEFE